MAIKNLRTIPKDSVIWYEDVEVTDQHIGAAYLTFPGSFDIQTWSTVFNNGLRFKYSIPWGNAKAELLNQWFYCGYTRSHHPLPVNFYDPVTNRIGSKTMADWLYILDHWYNSVNVAGNRVKMMWVLYLYKKEADKQIWPGYAQDTIAGEDAILGYCNALFGAYTSTTSATIGTGSVSVTMDTGQLLTSLNYVKLFRTSDPTKWMWGQVTSYDTGTGALVVDITNTNGTGTFTDWSIQYCSALGFTLAEHPTLARVEVSNEQFVNTFPDAAHSSAYARSCRIVSKIFKKYKPTIQVLGDSSDQGKPSFAHYMMGDAVSISGTPADGDFGTNKQACDYVDGQNCNMYTFSNGTRLLHDAAIAKNKYPHIYTKNLSIAKLESAFSTLTRHNVASNMHPSNPNYNGKTSANMVVCMGETSMCGAKTQISVSGGYWAYFLAGEDEAFYNLLRDYALKIVYCAARNGTSHMYVCDGSGSNASSTQGSITSTSVGAHSGGQVKLTIQNNPQYTFGVNGAGINIQNMSIVITAGAGGWADLGLAAAQKGEFTMSQVSGREVYLHNTTYTAQPVSDATYTEWQLDWNTRTKALKRLYETLTAGNVTIGETHLAGEEYPSMFIHVKDTVTYYLKSDGSVSKW